MNKNLLSKLRAHRQSGKKGFALLLDPDKLTIENLSTIVPKAKELHVDFIFFGGSLMLSDTVEESLDYIKNECEIPVILFPGNPSQVNEKADGLFFLSLISGRNSEMLIGHHVVSAPIIKKMNIEVLPTGYILIDGGNVTSVSYISNTTPIPSGKADIAACTAMAGEMLGLKIMYMDAGSGARNPIPSKTIQAVHSNTDCPVIVGGGIKTVEQAVSACQAGADVVVVGNAIESNPELMEELIDAVHKS